MLIYVDFPMIRMILPRLSGMHVFFPMHRYCSAILYQNLAKGGIWFLLWKHMSYRRNTWIFPICTYTGQ